MNKERKERGEKNENITQDVQSPSLRHSDRELGSLAWAIPKPETKRSEGGPLPTGIRTGSVDIFRARKPETRVPFASSKGCWFGVPHDAHAVGSQNLLSEVSRC